MNIEKRVSQLVAEKLEEINRPDLFLVNIDVSPTASRISILLDGDTGIGIDECAKVSRYVGFKLEEENAIEHAYNLEVSSPGADSPMVLERQYVKNIGRTVAIKLPDGAKKEGKLLAVGEGKVTIGEEVKEKGKKAQVQETAIEIEQIKEIRVVISFK